MLLPRTVVTDSRWIDAQDKAVWLTTGERAVSDGWRSETRRTEWLAGRLAAKRLLWEELGIAPLSWSVGRDGPAPSLGGLALPYTRLSLSHSGGIGAATLTDTRTEGSAGIDLQRIRPVHPGLCARVFTPDERRQIAAWFGSEDSADGALLLWALKEAAIKARRQAWSRPLRSIAVHLEGTGSATITLESAHSLTADYTRLAEERGHWWLARAVLKL